LPFKTALWYGSWAFYEAFQEEGALVEGGSVLNLNTEEDNMAREMAIVQSKVREYIRSKKLRTSDSFLVQLNERMFDALDNAIKRCTKNGRQTLRDQDA
jgi:hypothetical protein